jgi:hypothetical protein
MYSKEPEIAKIAYLIAYSMIPQPLRKKAVTLRPRVTNKTDIAAAPTLTLETKLCIQKAALNGVSDSSRVYNGHK